PIGLRQRSFNSAGQCSESLGPIQVPSPRGPRQRGQSPPTLPERPVTISAAELVRGPGEPQVDSRRPSNAATGRKLVRGIIGIAPGVRARLRRGSATVVPNG